MKLIKKVKNLIFSSELNKQIAKSSFWILLGTIISKGLLLVASIITARIIGKIEYGEFGIIRSTIIMFTTFASLGLGLTATKYIAQYRILDPDKTGRIISISNFFSTVLGVLFTILIIFFSNDLAAQINAPHLSYEIKLSSIMLFFNVVNGIQSGVLAGFEKFRIISINNIISAVISFFFQIIATYYYGLEGMILGFASNFLLLAILNYFSIKKITKGIYAVKFFSKSSFQEASVLWKFSLPAVLSGIMVSPVVWVCSYYLVNELRGYEEMANFDVANQWRTTILFIPSALSQIALPMLTANIKDKLNYDIILNKNIKLNIYISLVLVGGMIIISPIILSFYGEEYENAFWPLIIMLVTTGVLAVNNVIGQAIASQSKMWLGFFLNLMWGIVIMISSYVLIVNLKLGALGLAIAYLISYVFHTFVQFFTLKKVL